MKDGKISHYDDLFRRYAKEIGWDWRLLAPLAYTESNFNPNVVSWAGAKGLMQLMPATARAMGVPPGKEQDPEESIKAAVKYIAGMQRTFSKITDKEEQAKFILAAYNSGIGHVTDAMALAEKYGRNRYIWEHHVAHFMLLKSNKEYYQDPVCKNGYARGSDTYEFVHEILHVRNLPEEDKEVSCLLLYLLIFDGGYLFCMLGCGSILLWMYIAFGYGKTNRLFRFFLM